MKNKVEKKENLVLKTDLKKEKRIWKWGVWVEMK